METSPTWLHSTTFAAEPISAKRARAFVGARLIEHRLWHLVDPVRVVASELVTNAVVQGPAPITLTLSASTEDVVLSLRRPGSDLPRQRVPPEKELRGLGLTIVEVLSRSWGVTTDDDGGRELWASFPARARSAT